MIRFFLSLKKDYLILVMYFFLLLIIQFVLSLLIDILGLILNTFSAL